MKQYKILRPCLFFYRGQVITSEQLQQYFTPIGISKLVADGFITSIENNAPTLFTPIKA